MKLAESSKTPQLPWQRPPYAFSHLKAQLRAAHFPVTSTSPPWSLPLQFCPGLSWHFVVGFFEVFGCIGLACFVAAMSASSLGGERNPVFFSLAFRLAPESSFSAHPLPRSRLALNSIVSAALRRQLDLAQFVIAWSGNIDIQFQLGLRCF